MWTSRKATQTENGRRKARGWARQKEMRRGGESQRNQKRRGGRVGVWSKNTHKKERIIWRTAEGENTPGGEETVRSVGGGSVTTINLFDEVSASEKKTD